MPLAHSRSSILSLLLLAPLWAACADGPTAPPSSDMALEPVDARASSMAALQTTPEGHIRIGVIPAATTINVGAAGPFTVIDKASGTTLMSGAGEQVQVNLLVAGETRTRDWLQITCTGSTATRDQRVAEGLAAGFEVDTQDLGFCTRVLYGSIPAHSGAAARSAFQQALADAGLVSSGFWHTARTTVIGETTIEVTNGEETAEATSPVVVESADGRVTIGSRTYRGLAEVWTNSSGSLAGINELPLEEYLYGVVPRELPPVPYGAAEAQKAQAVAARTYAIANMGKRGIDGYDLLPTTGDQVYGGYEDEHPVSTAAIHETTGVVAVHNGTLISTLYHSTSGGWTANSEDVYANPVAYLRGVPDAERGKAMEHVPTLDVFMRNANPTNLRASAAGDFEADWSRYHRWTVDWTRAEMASVLAATLTQPITDVQQVRVIDRADQGRVRLIEFVTDAGTFYGEKDAIRWTLQYLDGNGDRASLRSTLFFIEPVHDSSTGEVTGWKAYGGGWGHGVGMSQTGAVGMAERGRTYQEILAHYYQGSTVEVRD